MAPVDSDSCDSLDGRGVVNLVNGEVVRVKRAGQWIGSCVRQGVDSEDLWQHVWIVSHMNEIGSLLENILSVRPGSFRDDRSGRVTLGGLPCSNERFFDGFEEQRLAFDHTLPAALGTGRLFARIPFFGINAEGISQVFFGMSMQP
ncbi:unnamed protein product [Enterobius vermicularis]|uniref:ATP-binding protein n=1 Tax=Enterobius vermicularis TaxID=51028 RepID=A0A0N4VKJ4_ENTVE|nr:unnamed protein product [Enterobius vermicularis]